MPRIGAERYFDEQLDVAPYRAAYEEARDRIRRTDALVRSLDECRQARGLTKAALARQAGLPPEAVRRLFTMRSPNPTAGTLVSLAAALDLDLVAVPKQRGASGAPRAARSTSTKKRAADG